MERRRPLATAEKENSQVSLRRIAVCCRFFFSEWNGLGSFEGRSEAIIWEACPS